MYLNLQKKGLRGALSVYFFFYRFSFSLKEERDNL